MKKIPLEDSVNDWVKSEFARMRQENYTVESSMSDFLKTAIQDGVNSNGLSLKNKGKKKRVNRQTRLELECFKNGDAVIPVIIENKLKLAKLSAKMATS